jgi:TatD DNase family protein
MKLIDTHSHLYLPQFKDDLDQVIINAKQNFLDRVYLPNIDSGSINDMLFLEEKLPEMFFPMIGLHPTSVDENYQEELKIVEKWLNNRGFAAIGEIGIDLYWDKTYVKQQVEAFEKQLNWAKDFGLPIVIHSRNSYREVLEVVDRNKDDKLFGVFHSFSGSFEEAQKIIQLGFKIGINGIVTFKNSKLDDVVKQIDINHLVIETDSPFLAPEPKRGRRNESSYLYYIAEKIAEIKGLRIEEVAAITTDNAMNMFKE